MFKKGVILAACLLALFIGLWIYLFIDNIKIRDAFEALYDTEEIRYQGIIDSNQEAIKSDLEKRYGTDMASFKETINQFEKEQEKTRALEKMLERR
jgi:hypothetical protein